MKVSSKYYYNHYAVFHIMPLIVNQVLSPVPLGGKGIAPHQQAVLQALIVLKFNSDVMPIYLEIASDSTG